MMMGFLIILLGNFVYLALGTTDQQVYIELKSYAVTWNPVESKYEIGLTFWNNKNGNEQVLVNYIAAPPFVATPPSQSMTFSAYQIKSAMLNLSAPSETTGILGISIFKFSGNKIFERDYSIIIQNDMNGENPAIVNESIYIDINVDVDVNNTIILVYPDIGFKLIVLGAAIFTAAALFVQSQKVSNEQIKNIHDPEEKRKQRNAENESKGSFFSLAGGIIVYYVSSGNVEFGGLFKTINYGYEIGALLAAGIAYFIIRAMFGEKNRFKRIGHASKLTAIMILLNNPMNWEYALLFAIVGLLCYGVASRSILAEHLQKFRSARKTHHREKKINKNQYFRREVV